MVPQHAERAELFDALTAAEQLVVEGLDGEVLDLRTVVPLDTERILESVGKTKRAVVAHHATAFCRSRAEVAATVAGALFGKLRATVLSLSRASRITSSRPKRWRRK